MEPLEFKAPEGKDPHHFKGKTGYWFEHNGRWFFVYRRVYMLSTGHDIVDIYAERGGRVYHSSGIEAAADNDMLRTDHMEIWQLLPDKYR